MFGRAISSSSLILTIGLFFSACGQEQVDNSGAFNQTSTNYGLVCPGEVPDTSSKVTIKAIYGEDNRLDWFEAPGRTTEYWARASLALMYSSRLFEDGDDFVIQGPTYQETANLCPGESFASQPSAAFCSGFLVAPDIVVTAGHCVRDDIDCATTRFVFDYSKTNASQEKYRVAKSSVYRCQEVIAQEDLRDDFAVIRLDRQVEDRTPLNLRRSDSLGVGEQLMIIGHPMGLPSKIADGGFALTVGNVIEASVDAFAANSGSVILNSKTGLVEGILVAGEADFFLDGNCRREAVCDGTCRGEIITPTAKFSQFIPNIIYNNPVCQ